MLSLDAALLNVLYSRIVSWNQTTRGRLIRRSANLNLGAINCFPVAKYGEELPCIDSWGGSSACPMYSARRELGIFPGAYHSVLTAPKWGNKPAKLGSLAVWQHLATNRPVLLGAPKSMSAGSTSMKRIVLLVLHSNLVIRMLNK